MTDPRAEQLAAIASARAAIAELHADVQAADEDDLQLIAATVEQLATDLGLAAAYPGGPIALGHLAGEADAIRRTWELGYIALMRVRELLTYALESCDLQLIQLAEDVDAD